MAKDKVGGEVGIVAAIIVGDAVFGFGSALYIVHSFVTEVSDRHFA